MKRLPTMALALVAALFAIAPGCASIVSKSQYPVTVKSNPSGAMVTIRNSRGIDVQKVTTPATIVLPACDGYLTPARYTFTYENDGYIPASYLIPAVMDNWYFGNILFGGVIGILVIDPLTGAMWRLDDTVYGRLSPDPDFQD
jgi:hypothetical protein